MSSPLKICANYSFFFCSISASLLTTTYIDYPKVVFVFGLPRPRDRVFGLLTGTDPFIEEPFELEVLMTGSILLLFWTSADRPNYLCLFLKLSGDIYCSFWVNFPKSGRPRRNCFSKASASLSIEI